MRRRLLILLGCLLGCVLLALAALPWWLGAALKLGAGSRGLTFSRYEKLSYGRFALHDVVLTRPGVKVSLDRVEADSPLPWWWRHRQGGGHPVVATRWSVEVTPVAHAAPPPPSQFGAVKLHELLLRIAAQLDRWLPQAEIGPGVVRWKNGQVSLASAVWSGRTLVAKGVEYGPLNADVTVGFPSGGSEIRADAIAATQGWSAALRNRERELSGEVRLWEQLATLTARFSEQGWMPAEAQVRAPAWQVAGARARLGGTYAFLRGQGQLDWRDGRFTAAVKVAGEPIKGKSAPPLAADIRAHGDPETVTIDAIDASLPGVTARLSDSIVLDRHGKILTNGSRFTFDVDLARQPWIEAQGRVSGEARVTPVADRVPQVSLGIKGQGIAVAGWDIVGLGADAVLEWPRLTVKNATLTLADNDRAALRGTYDFAAKEILGGEVDANLSRAEVARWLPVSADFRGLRAVGKVSGPIATLQHEGRLELTDFSYGRVRPTSAVLAWKGEGASAEIADGHLRAGSAELAFSGAIDANGARLTALRLLQGGAEQLALAEPAVVRWKPAVQFGPVKLRGAESSLAVTAVWGGSGSFDIAARAFSSKLLADFIELPGPEWRIVSLDARGQWDRAPMDFDVKSEFAIKIGPERTATLRLQAEATKRQIRIQSLAVSEGTAPIVTVTGQLPVALQPGGEKFLTTTGGAEIDLKAVTTANPAFWAEISRLTGFELQQPEVDLQLAGTWEKPRGVLHAHAGRIAPVSSRMKEWFPAIDSLEAHASSDGRVFSIDRFEVRVEGQPVSARGQVPVAMERWSELRRDPVGYLRREGALEVKIDNAEMAALAHYAPGYLAPKGRLDLDVSVRPGGSLEGVMRIRDATSRPLGPLGVLQEVNAEVQFSGRKAELRSVSAKAGGQPVTLTGSVALPEKSAPKFDLSLKGENLPFVRQAGLILRGDVDLKLVTDADDVPRISGTAQLRDSLFLSDIRALIPRGGPTAPAKRPPYFAIESGPLSTWRLAVDVEGDHFMRLRTAFFNGVASARFHLGGTFAVPRATGEAVVDSGQVLLPFATFRVQQGTVELTEADPYEPQLFVTGTARRYGYDVQMEVTGAASAPIVTFSSSPALEAEQVLLMVMAGEPPRDEVADTTTQRVARIGTLGTYLGQSLLNRLGADATDAERLSIATGEKVSRQGRETYEIEYALNDRFTAVGEYDEFDEFNAGIKWRILSEKSAAEKAAKKSEAKKRDDGK
jgi:translocation and assembly module TamB